MILTLEVIGAQAAKLGEASRQVFTTGGGIIGRDRSCDWVLSHTKVSSRHASISYANGVFYVEDTSTNGVFINSPRNRIDRGRPYPLRSGDRLYIDPYEIRASITEEEEEDREHDLASPVYGQPPIPGRQTPQRSLEVVPGQEVDPLKLLDPGPAAPAARKTPKARDLESNSPVDAHYKPPAPINPPAATPTPSPSRTPPPLSPELMIPADYDPLKPDDFDEFLSWEPPPPPAQADATPPPVPLPVEVSLPPPEPVRVAETPPVVAEQTPVPTPVPTPLPTPLPDPSVPPAQTYRSSPARHGAESDLAQLLAGAGLEGVAATPELARNFGEILRVVVSGVMDVLRSRQHIKDEFRMRMTQFRPADNNPLKFSANVDDALHNLLVKRNAAYLPPVEAFEDAFDDLRNHQLAMLAGMRVAFEAMLGEFDPDRLQQQFDRNLKAGWALGMTSTLPPSLSPGSVRTISARCSASSAAS